MTARIVCLVVGQAVVALALFGLAAGVSLSAVAMYWERQPLGPRDGQAFLGIGFLGYGLIFLGALLAAMAALARRAAPWLGPASAIPMAAGASLAVLALARGPERWLGIGAEAQGLDELAMLLRAVAGLAALAAIVTPMAVRRARAGPLGKAK